MIVGKGNNLGRDGSIVMGPDLSQDVVESGAVNGDSVGALSNVVDTGVVNAVTVETERI